MNVEALKIRKQEVERQFNLLESNITQERIEQHKLQGEFRLINDLLTEQEADASTIVVKEKKGKSNGK